MLTGDTHLPKNRSPCRPDETALAENDGALDRQVANHHTDQDASTRTSHAPEETFPNNLGKLLRGQEGSGLM